jgi:hypothetical protein
MNQNKQTVECGLLTGSGQTLVGGSGHSYTEPIDGTE